jgi:hypothetical protein
MNVNKIDREEENRTCDEIIDELAGALRDVIQGTPDAALEQKPEDAYTDLACRLVFRLAAKYTIAPVGEPVVPSRERMVRRVAERNIAKAAQRTLETLSRWMAAHPRSSFLTEIDSVGKFTLIVAAPVGMNLFSGTSIQDAYAQAASAINMNEGAL